MAISYSWVDERLNYTGNVDLEVQAFTKVSKCLKSYAATTKSIEGSSDGSDQESGQGTCDPGESANCPYGEISIYYSQPKSIRE